MPNLSESPVVLITGAARRIGACLAKRLHECGFRIIVHYHHSLNEANSLCEELNNRRHDSAWAVSADMTDIASVEALASASISHWGRLDALINNASSFYRTPLPDANKQQWGELIGSNLQGPFFLCQAVSEELIMRRGAIINITDIHAHQPLARHSIYCIAKAGNTMLTRTMAKELAPHVRVNGIAPGVILWPENICAENTEKIKNNSLPAIPLKRMGTPEDIALLAEFLITDASYITGQIITVDGGKHLIF